MATTVGLRKILDRKSWEQITTYPATNTMVGRASTQFDQLQLWMDTSSNTFLYDPKEDGWISLTASGMSTFSSASGVIAYHPTGPSGTASAGGASTLTTTLTCPGSVAGYTVRITGGTGAGQERVIASNTYTANCVLTVGTPWDVAPTAGSTYTIFSGRFWVFHGAATVELRFYDVATNVWSAALSVAGVTAAASWGFVSTPAYGNPPLVSGTATSATATTLVNAAKTWTANQFRNQQVRITGGVGIGQVRTITANDATTVTVAAWTTTPDATSTYAVEPNDDYLYAATGTLVYRYSIAANTWSTVPASGGVRGTGLGFGGSLSWTGAVTDATWNDESNLKNGRYLYSFAGGGTAGSAGHLGVYDIGLQGWANLGFGYGRGGWAQPATGGFVPAGSYSSVNDRENIYFAGPVSYSLTTNMVVPFWRFNMVTMTLEPWTALQQLPGTAGAFGPGRLTVTVFTDGGTTLRWLNYMGPSVGNVPPVPFYRALII